MISLQGWSDPHWGHGERVPARQPRDAEPGGQHHPPHWLRTLWHCQWLNRASDSVAPGECFFISGEIYASLGCFIFTFYATLLLPGVL